MRVRVRVCACACVCVRVRVRAPKKRRGCQMLLRFDLGLCIVMLNSAFWGSKTEFPHLLVFVVQTLFLDLKLLVK